MPLVEVRSPGPLEVAIDGVRLELQLALLTVLALCQLQPVFVPQSRHV